MRNFLYCICGPPTSAIFLFYLLRSLFKYFISSLPCRRPGRDTGAAWASGDTFCATQSGSTGRRFWRRADRKWVAGCTRPPRARRPPFRSWASRTGGTRPSGTHLAISCNENFHRKALFYHSLDHFGSFCTIFVIKNGVQKPGLLFKVFTVRKYVKI